MTESPRRGDGPDRRLVHSTSPSRSVSAYQQRVPQRAPLEVGQPSNPDARRTSTVRLRPPAKSRRRFGLILGAGAVVIILVVTLRGVLGETDSFPVPSQATLAGLSVPQRIMAIAQSQVGYSTEPTDSYCNKFSAYWNAGAPDCPSGEKSEEWCADFAAWAWHKAGVTFTYGYGPARSTAQPSASTSGGSPTASGTRLRADMSLRPATWRSTVSRSGRSRRPCTWR